MADFTITFPGGKRVDAQVGPYLVQTDQPKEEGGDGAAPEPFKLFLASIGTCAGIYVLGFCQSRGIPADGISITQSNHWDKEQRRVTEVSLRVHLPATFPEKYKDAVLRAADLCTVKRNILAPPEFKIEAVTA
jgi:ribosomal protein S12 methylthiotransferase accessory factor